MAQKNTFRGYNNPYAGAQGNKRGKLRPGFVDYGAVVSQRIKPGLDRMISDRKKKEEAYGEQINNMGAVDFQKLPEGLKSKMQTTMQGEYANMKEGSRLMLTGEVGSEKYMKGKAMYDNGVENIKGYNAGFDKLLQVRTDGQTGFAQSMYSAGNDHDKMENHLDLVAGNADPEDYFIGNGVVGFRGQNIMGYVNPGYKNTKVVTDVDAFYTKYFNQSVEEGIPYNKVVGNADLTSILTDSKGDGRRSLAHDWLIPDPKGSGRKFSFATSYGVERPANMNEIKWKEMKDNMDKLHPDRSQIQKNYEAGLYNKEKGAVGGSGKHDSWINDPAMDDILHNEEIKFFGDMIQSISDNNVKKFNDDKDFDRVSDVYKAIAGTEIPANQLEYNNTLDRATKLIENTDLIKQWRLKGGGEPAGGYQIALTAKTMDNLSSNIIDMLRIEQGMDGVEHMTRDQAYNGEWDPESKTYKGGWKQLAEEQGINSSKAAFDREFPRADGFNIFESKDGSFFGKAQIDIEQHFKRNPKTDEWSLNQKAVGSIARSLARYTQNMKKQNEYIHGFDRSILNQNHEVMMSNARKILANSKTN